MVSEKDNQRCSAFTQYLEYSVLTRIEERTEQQDCFGYANFDNETLFVLCDGMGGYSAGKRAAKSAVDTVLKFYGEHSLSPEPVSVLIKALENADGQIASFTDADGMRINSGSTAVCVLIRERHLFWCSVGDSRAYLVRNVTWGRGVGDKPERGCVPWRPNRN